MGNPITILRGEGRGRGQAGGMELKLEPTGIFVNTLVYVVFSLTPPSAIRGECAGVPKSVYVCASDPMMGSLLEDQHRRLQPSTAGVCHSLHCQ